MESVLGVVIAGGASRRFGTDKAEAAWQGRTLLAHALAALSTQVDAVVLSGRACLAYPTLADRPPGIGPIGGLAAALHHALRHGHAAVLSVPVDVHPLPADLVTRLGGPGPAVFATQHLVGWWPSLLAPALDDFTAAGGRSLVGWIEHCRAQRVAEPAGLVNVNRTSDLARLR